MANRVTPTLLRARVATLNRLLGRPADAYKTVDGRNVAQVGVFVLTSAYGGWSVAEISSESGGERHAIGMYGHVPARECLSHLDGAVWIAQELAPKAREHLPRTAGYCDICDHHGADCTANA